MTMTGELKGNASDTLSESALASIVTEHGRMVQRVAYRITRDPHLAEDVCQAVFCVLLSRRKEIRSLHSLGAWLHQVTVLTARNTIRNEVRRRRREGEAARREQEERAEAMELPDHFDEAVADLPRTYREVIVMRFLKGRSCAEIGQAMAVSEGAVAVRLSRGLELLRKALA